MCLDRARSLLRNAAGEWNGRQAQAEEGPQGRRGAESLRVRPPEGRGMGLPDDRGTLPGRFRAEVIFEPGQGAGEPQPGAGGHEEDGSAVGEAKAGAARPAPAEDESRRQQDEPAHGEQGEEGVSQRDEVGEEGHDPQASRSRGNGSQESPGRRRALYSQKETGRPWVSRR